MTITDIINQIDTERMYQTVTRLEGPRYPLDNMDALNAAGDYIAEQLRSYGLTVEMQKFKVDGVDETFKNVIGCMGDQSRPSILLGSHYDTVPNCPGANDNLSAVAISLEVARILARMEQPPSVIIAAFTLEEGHPGIAKIIREKFLECGIIDSQFRFASASMLKFSQLLNKKLMGYFRQAKMPVEALKATREELKGELSEDELRYIDIRIEANQSVSNRLPYGIPGLTALVGSSQYVSKIMQDGTKIKEVIIYDTVGWIKNEPHTQKPLPVPPEMKEIVKLHKVDLENLVGNFVMILGEKSSTELLNKFLKHCENEEIDIPYFGVDIPLDCTQISQLIPDVLRSDHAPFWQAGIPGIFLADTSDFRSEYYHTPADISGLMDFEILKKLAQATVKTIL